MPNTFRGAIAQVNRSDLSGRRVWKGTARDWWDPNNVGLSIAGAYRAINSVGTPWGGGPTLYAQSLVNQANPGVNDLVEGNGAVPWVQAIGWGFVAALLQYFDTGLVPANDQSWSIMAQIANFDTTFLSSPFFSNSGANRWFGVQHQAGGVIIYYNGSFQLGAGAVVNGNIGVVGNQGYLDGVADGGAVAGWAGIATQTIFIGAQNVGLANRFCTADIESVAIYNAGPAAVQAEAAAIAAAMAAL